MEAYDLHCHIRRHECVGFLAGIEFAAYLIVSHENSHRLSSNKLSSFGAAQVQSAGIRKQLKPTQPVANKQKRGGERGSNCMHVPLLGLLQKISLREAVADGSVQTALPSDQLVR